MIYEVENDDKENTKEEGTNQNQIKSKSKSNAIKCEGNFETWPQQTPLLCPLYYLCILQSLPRAYGL